MAELLTELPTEVDVEGMMSRALLGVDPSSRSRDRGTSDTGSGKAGSGGERHGTMNVAVGAGCFGRHVGQAGGGGGSKQPTPNC